MPFGARAKILMKVRINETLIELGKAESLDKIISRFKPGTDIYILNGFPAEKQTVLKDGDQIVLIKRGEVPSESEMESLMVARHTPGVHSRLKSGMVGVAGLGSIACGCCSSCWVVSG